MEIFNPTFTFGLTMVFAVVLGFLHFAKERRMWHPEILNLWEWLTIVTMPLPSSLSMMVYAKIPIYWFLITYAITFLFWIIIGIYNRKNLIDVVRRNYDAWIVAFTIGFLYFGMVLLWLIQTFDVLETRMGCYVFETAKEWLMNMQHCN